jgi:beta-lactamase class A
MIRVVSIALSKTILILLIVLAGFEFGTSALGQVDTSAGLQARISALAAARREAGKGSLALYAVQLGGGAEKSVEVDADKPVQTASVIKLAILYEAMVAVREGRAKWDEPTTLKPGDTVGGSGMLHFFDTPLQLTLKDVLTMMVIVSDNTATNLAIDRFGIDAVNARMERLGLKDTHLYKKVFKPATGPMPADQPKFGLGKTTPREMATLMTYIGECKLRKQVYPLPPGASPAVLPLLPMDDADKAVCEVGLGMLKNQFYRETVPRYLESMDASDGGVAIASKTGSLDAVRNDVAIVSGREGKGGGGPMVLAIFTYDNKDHGWTVDNEGEMTIAQVAKEIVTLWSPAGLDGKKLVPGLGLGEVAVHSP